MPSINLGLKKQRDPTVNKKKYQFIYQDKRWRRIRNLKFKNDPLCERCLENNRVHATEEIHHIIPFQTGKTEEEVQFLAFNYDNLQSLCIDCHKIVENLIRNKR